MSELDSRDNRGPFIFRFLGWILSGLSVLNLIRDMSPLELYGLLRDWVDAYSTLVGRVGRFLFGWIDLWWIKIDPLEYHVILLALLVGSAFGKAMARLNEYGDGGRTVSGLFWGLVMTVLFVLLMLILPDPWGTRIGLGIEALIVVGFATFDAGDGMNIWFRIELLVVSTAFSLLIALNYLFFKP